MARYIAGTPQEVGYNDGRRGYDGVDEHRPFATGIRPNTAFNKFYRLYGRAPSIVWDSKEGRIAELEQGR